MHNPVSRIGVHTPAGGQGESVFRKILPERRAKELAVHKVGELAATTRRWLYIRLQKQRVLAPDPRRRQAKLVAPRRPVTIIDQQLQLLRIGIGLKLELGQLLSRRVEDFCRPRRVFGNRALDAGIAGGLGNSGTILEGETPFPHARTEIRRPQVNRRLL